MFETSGTGHPDHAAGHRCRLAAADVLDIDLVVPVDGARQRAAIAAHASQAVPTSVLWPRLELLGSTEHLRRLRAPHRRE